MYVIVGLGNPGEEYELTRHNVGRIVLNSFAKKNVFSEWVSDKKTKALLSKGQMGKEKITLLEPETFMNKSGLSVKPLVTSVKKAEKLIVIYDDLDLAMGDFKISYNKNSGGHKGIESIIKTIKTKGFIRVRVGISPTTLSGKLKKPKGEDKVLNLIMKDFKKPDLDKLKKVSKEINEALEMIIKEGRARAMNKYN